MVPISDSEFVDILRSAGVDPKDLDVLYINEQQNASDLTCDKDLGQEASERLLKARRPSDVLRERLDEIVAQLHAANTPSEEDRLFADVLAERHAQTRLALTTVLNEFERIEKATDEILKVMRSQPELRQMFEDVRRRGKAKPTNRLTDLLAGLAALNQWAKEVSAIDRRGRPSDAALDTAVLELASVFQDHFDCEREVWELPIASSSHFAEFMAAVLQCAGFDLSAETLVKRWARLRKTIIPQTTEDGKE